MIVFPNFQARIDNLDNFCNKFRISVSRKTLLNKNHGNIEIRLCTHQVISWVLKYLYWFLYLILFIGQNTLAKLSVVKMHCVLFIFFIYLYFFVHFKCILVLSKAEIRVSKSTIMKIPYKNKVTMNLPVNFRVSCSN